MDDASERGTVGGFWSYYRRYTKTAVHAASAAALTGLGYLTTVHEGFAVLAVAAYVLPPVYLYATRAESERPPTGGDADESAGESDAADAPSAGDETAPDSGDEGPSEDPELERDRWTTATVPTDATLRAVTADGRPCAVGDGGVVLARGGDGWRAVVDDGPGAASNALQGADATEDGRVWFAGDGGALGRLDADRVTDHSAPEEMTSTWNDVAVAGRAGREAVYLATGSGEIVRGRNDDGDLSWAAPVKPGSGSSVAAVAFDSPERGVACDTGGGVYETTDGGREWERIGAADAALHDVAFAGETLYAVTGDGSALRYDGDRWTRRSVADAPLLAVAGYDGSTELLAVGEDGVYRRADDWERVDLPTLATFRCVATGEGGTAVAAGDDGTVVERTQGS